MKVVDEKSFQAEVLESDVPVLVDFWSPWCPPCNSMMPLLEKLSQDYLGVKIVKVNFGENLQLAERFKVMALPTFVFFKKGQVVETLTGAQTESVLKIKLDALTVFKDVL